MLKISTAQFLFMMEIIALSVGAAIFFFFQNRKLKSRTETPHTESPTPKEARAEPVKAVQKNLQQQPQKSGEVSEWKEKAANLQHKFDDLREINTKLKELIRSLLPKSARTQELEQLLSDMEISRNELDACIGGLRTELKDVGDEISSFKNQLQEKKKEAEAQKEEITQLKRKLKDTVKKADYDSIEADRNRLTNKVEQMEKQLKERNEEYKKLEKEHMWLEKEYNRIYNNIDDEYEETLKEAASKKSVPETVTQPDGEPAAR